jgi:hypothetical protein
MSLLAICLIVAGFVLGNLFALALVAGGSK